MLGPYSDYSIPRESRILLHPRGYWFVLITKMGGLRFLQDLQLTELFSAGVSEVRKYAKVALIVFICFTAVVVFKVKYSKQNLFMSSNAATLDKSGHNITAELVTGIAQNTTFLAKQILSPSSNAATLDKSGQNSTAERVTVIAQNTTFLAKQILSPSSNVATLDKSGQNITAGRETGIAQDTTFSTITVENVTVTGLGRISQNTTLLVKTAENVTVGCFGRVAQNITNESEIVGERTNTSKAANASDISINHEQNLYEELASAFDKGTCLSRYESSSYRKNQPYKPSPYLISKLRAYQDLHSRCGPHTSSYKRVIKRLGKSSSNYHDTTQCKYLVWTPANGLGNRMVSITSAFLYALLKSRVLLVEFEADMDDLFCEPFPNSTWLLPKNFPHKHYWTSLPSLENRGHSPIVHLHLQHGKNDSFIEHFHCDDTQSLLETVPVVVIISDQYFAPSLFLMPSFEKELEKMFPEKGAVFHLLGHYLFNPSNTAWGLITRFYKAYLSNADEKIGLQIRVFQAKGVSVPYETITSQILSCTQNHHILPSLGTNKSPSQNTTPKSKAVLVSSLYPQFSENIRYLYWVRPTLTGDVIGVYQPSHEEFQKFGDNMHNMKAWAEMYLLSLCDVMVTSSRSTFGYVAHGLAGVKPWILKGLGGTNVPNPSCKHDISSEPCFHIGLKNSCNGKKISNVTAVNSHLYACEDWRFGVKLVNG